MDTPEYLSENESVYEDEMEDVTDTLKPTDKKAVKINLSTDENENEDDDDDNLEDEEDMIEDEIYDQSDEENNIENEDLEENAQDTIDDKFNINDQEVVISDDESDDEYDDNYYKKFDIELKENYILNRHSNLLQNNYDEIETLSKITNRNKDNIINDDIHRTIPILTKYEKARILGLRAKQLENGSLPLIDIDSSIIDAYLIATKELEQKKIPFVIKRPLPNGASEYWKIKDLELISD